MTEIYRIKTLAGPAFVKADSSAKALGYARRGIKAERLSGVEVLDLPADAMILDASQSAAEAAGEGGDDADGGEG